MTDWRRVVAIKSGNMTSSGYRVTPRLVLTTGHGICDPSTRVDVAFMEPPGKQSAAELVWHSSYGCQVGNSLDPGTACGHGDGSGIQAASPALDLALLQLGTEKVTPVRWGRFVTGTTQRAGAVGFPDLQRYHGYLDPYGVRGEIEPATGHWTTEYYLDQLRGSPVRGTRDWRGMSGAAVFVSGFLTGCLQTFQPDRGRFTIMPATRMLHHPCLRAWIEKDARVAPVPEPVELLHVFTSPPLPPQTPAQLLDAEVAVTPFQGDTRLVKDLLLWARSAHGTQAQLLSGPMGSGKTRTAVEVIRRLMRESRWDGAAGFVSREERSASDWVRLLEDIKCPLLFVVDRAETSLEQIDELLDGVRHRTTSAQVRVLLLARSAGTLANRWHVEQTVTAPGVPACLYGAARGALDKHLERMRLGQAPASTSTRLPALAADLANPGDVQLDALSELLRERRLTLPGDPRMALLDMEREYVRSAVGGLLPQIDEELLDLVLTSLALSGERGESQAVADVLDAVRFRYWHIYRHILGGGDLGTDYRVVREVDTIVRVLGELYPPQDTACHGRFPDAVAAAQIVATGGWQRGQDFVTWLLEEDRRPLAASYALEEVHHHFPDAMHGLLFRPAEPGPVAEPSAAKIGDLTGANDVDLPQPPSPWRPAPDSTEDLRPDFPNEPLPGSFGQDDPAPSSNDVDLDHSNDIEPGLR
ncbi:hypothetical protein ABZX38_32155 [Streptomyces longwoodensis]|uniref:hypothetical protein n=1 Tax=Streptomyces longwoodensis TaxID=68231 RepID=UPI0033AD7A8E